MGNSPLNSCLIKNGNQACQVKVRGTSATVIFDGKEVEKSINGKITEMWDLIYKVGNSTCRFRLSKKVSPNRRHGEVLNIIISEVFDLSCTREFTVTLKKDEVGLLHHTHLAEMQSCHVANWTTFTTNTNADITETSFEIYEGEEANKRGLTITEWKKKNKYSKPYMGSVTHYFLSLSDGEEVGLSIAIKKIRVRNGQLDFVVDGPKQHPVDQLDYMFDQLLPSFKNNGSHSSESESDADRNVDDAVPSPHHRGHSRNAGGLVSNDGMYNGNYNGSTFIKNFIVGLKDKFM